MASLLKMGTSLMGKKKDEEGQEESKGGEEGNAAQPKGSDQPDVQAADSGDKDAKM
jgi:hypothetical protein